MLPPLPLYTRNSYLSSSYFREVQGFPPLRRVYSRGLASGIPTLQPRFRHTRWIKNTVELFFRKISSFACHLADGFARFIGFFGDVGGGIIANNRSQRGT